MSSLFAFPISVRYSKFSLLCRLPFPFIFLNDIYHVREFVDTSEIPSFIPSRPPIPRTLGRRFSIHWIVFSCMRNRLFLFEFIHFFIGNYYPILFHPRSINITTFIGLSSPRFICQQCLLNFEFGSI